jgi:O-antigen/teichoic acid export membrane protein
VRELWTSVASTSAARAYSLFVSAFTVMIAARWLGPAGQGTVAAVTAWAMLFATIGSLSLGQVALHRATVHRNQEWLEETLGTMLTVAVGVTLLCWAVALTLYFVTAGRFFNNIPPRVLLFGFLLVPFVVWEFYGSNLLMAADRIPIYNRALLIGRSVGLVLMLIAWRLHFGVIAAIFITILAQAVVALTGIRYLFAAAGRKMKTTFATARELLSGAAKLHLKSISGFVYTSLGVLLVNHFRGPVETGLFQFASSLVNVLIVIPMSASLVLSARVARLGPDGAWAYQRRIVPYLSLIMIGVALIAAVCAPVAVPLVVGSKYVPAVPVFQLLLIGVIGMTFSSVMSSQWIGRGYFWTMSLISLGVAVIYLVSSLLLLPRYGMYGAVYASLITQGIVIVVNGALALKCEAIFRHSGARHLAKLDEFA